MRGRNLVGVRVMGKIRLSALRVRINFFYALAFAPLLLVAYYKHVSGVSILGVLIPFYGFLLLFFKKDKLSLFPHAEGVQRFLGLFALLASFLVYYLLIRFCSPVFYGAGAFFYAIYIVGLFLVFFSAPALNESFSALFLVVAGGSSFYVGEWLNYFMEPAVPFFVRIMVFVLMLLGIPATVSNPHTIMLDTSRGLVPVLFEAGCIGIQSFLIFSIIIVVTMMEESATVRTKLLWSLGGVVGTFVVNIIRVSLIAAVIYYFGYENWGEIHAWIGYALFLVWLAFFFIVFSKREIILQKTRAFAARRLR
jgi:exosortase/archaeosortase family protein